MEDERQLAKKFETVRHTLSLSASALLLNFYHNWTIYFNFTRLIPIVTAVHFVIVDFKEMNE